MGWIRSKRRRPLRIWPETAALQASHNSSPNSFSVQRKQDVVVESFAHLPRWWPHSRETWSRPNRQRPPFLRRLFASQPSSHPAILKSLPRDDIFFRLLLCVVLLLRVLRADDDYFRQSKRRRQRLYYYFIKYGRHIVYCEPITEHTELTLKGINDREWGTWTLHSDLVHDCSDDND